jgi:hypothetical protein
LFFCFSTFDALATSIQAQWSSAQLRASLAIRFVGERAVGAGVLREW